MGYIGSGSSEHATSFTTSIKANLGGVLYNRASNNNLDERPGFVLFNKLYIFLKKEGLPFKLEVVNPSEGLMARLCHAGLPVML